MLPGTAITDIQGCAEFGGGGGDLPHGEPEAPGLDKLVEVCIFELQNKPVHGDDVPRGSPLV